MISQVAGPKSHRALEVTTNTLNCTWKHTCNQYSLYRNGIMFAVSMQLFSAPVEASKQSSRASPFRMYYNNLISRLQGHELLSDGPPRPGIDTTGATSKGVRRPCWPWLPSDIWARSHKFRKIPRLCTGSIWGHRHLIQKQRWKILVTGRSKYPQLFCLARIESEPSSSHPVSNRPQILG